MKKKYDILIKSDHSIFPDSKIEGNPDIGILNGKIHTIQEEIPEEQAKQVIQGKGFILTPLLQDFHTHLYHTTTTPDAWAGDLSVDPDCFSFSWGVGKMVDAGSSGWRNFSHFKSTVIERVQTNVQAFLNVAPYGMLSPELEQVITPGDIEKTAEMAMKYPHIIRGIKCAHYHGEDWLSVDSALGAGEKSHLPIMVDSGYFLKSRPYWQLLEEKLRPGDITTHCFRAPVPVADDKGRLYTYLWRAKDKGILFDVGHGGGSFIFQRAYPAIREGFYPDIISTDLHKVALANGLISLPNLMSKFLAMGMPLNEIIRATTIVPACVSGSPGESIIARGGRADFALLKLTEGSFRFKDSVGGIICGSQRIEALLTICNGNVVYDRDNLVGTPYQNLPFSAGITEHEDYVIPPINHNGV